MTTEKWLIFLFICLLYSCNQRAKNRKAINISDTIIVDAGGGIYKLDGDSIAWIEPTQIIDDSSGMIWLVHTAPQKHRVGLLNYKFPPPLTVVVIIDNDTMRYYNSDTLRIKTEFGNLMAENQSKEE